MIDRVADGVAGVLAGLAAGDRNGGPTEMAVRLAESLAAVRAFDPADVLQRYVTWHREGAFDTGPVTGRVLALIGRGVAGDAAVLAVDEALHGLTAGCNPAHRVAPLAMAAFLPDDQLPDTACVEARLTHLHPLAGEVATAVAVLCRALVRDETWEAARERAAASAPGAATALYPRAPSAGGFAPEALAAAVWFVDRGASFAEALGASLAFAGPANYCPVLVGAIGGARWGRAAVSDATLCHCRDLRRVSEAAEALASEWAG